MKIVNQQRKDRDGNIVRKNMKIGSYNLFESGCVVSSSDIGDYNEFQINSKIGGGCLIGSGCCFTPGIIIPNNTKIANNLVYFGDGMSRKDL